MYFFDSSAVIEILKDNEGVINRYKGNTIVTINLGYGEIYYYCIKEGINREKFRSIIFEIIDYNLEDIEKAMELLYRRKRETKDFSFVDSLIYTVASKMGAILVTKDLGLKGLPDVELIPN